MHVRVAFTTTTCGDTGKSEAKGSRGKRCIKYPGRRGAYTELTRSTANSTSGQLPFRSETARIYLLLVPSSPVIISG